MGDDGPVSNGFYLASDDLCSKWGFNDGDAPDEFCEIWEEHGYSHQHLAPDAFSQ